MAQTSNVVQPLSNRFRSWWLCPVRYVLVCRLVLRVSVLRNDDMITLERESPLPQPERRKRVPFCANVSFSYSLYTISSTELGAIKRESVCLSDRYGHPK